MSLSRANLFGRNKADYETHEQNIAAKRDIQCTEIAGIIHIFEALLYLITLNWSIKNTALAQTAPQFWLEELANRHIFRKTLPPTGFEDEVSGSRLSARGFEGT